MELMFISTWVLSAIICSYRMARHLIQSQPVSLLLRIVTIVVVGVIQGYFPALALLVLLWLVTAWVPVALIGPLLTGAVAMALLYGGVQSLILRHVTRVIIQSDIALANTRSQSVDYTFAVVRGVAFLVLGTFTAFVALSAVLQIVVAP